MTIEQLQKDMIAAMKAHDKERKDAISSLVSAVKKNAIDAGCRENIPEDMVNTTIMKELKTVQEQIDSCPKDRTELIAEYQKRHDIMQEYAPKLLSKEEVVAIVQEKFADVLAGAGTVCDHYCVLGLARYSREHLFRRYRRAVRDKGRGKCN